MFLKHKILWMSSLVILIMIAGAFYWSLKTGLIKPWADPLTLSCQYESDLTAFYGPPGTNLVDFTLLGKTIKVNQKIVPMLQKVQDEINKSGVQYPVDPDGVQSVSSKRKNNGAISLHAYGLAIDINPNRNPYTTGRAICPHDIPDAYIKAFEDNGFGWGGRWGTDDNCDGMHFEAHLSEVSGAIIDKDDNKPLMGSEVFYDSQLMGKFDGSYNFMVAAGRHNISVQHPGYRSFSQDFDFPCNKSVVLDAYLSPQSVGEGLGRISGVVKFAGSSAPMLATLYLDDQVAGTTDVLGNYSINNVVMNQGHKLRAVSLLQNDVVAFFTLTQPDQKIDLTIP